MAEQLSPKEKRNAERAKSITDFVRSCESDTSKIRNGWRESYNMFVWGSTFNEKQDWQADFSVNEVGNAMRGAHSALRNIIVENPNWWDLEVRAKGLDRAERLRLPLKKILNYHLEAGQFKKHASTFILASLVSIGAMGVGWKNRLVVNPKFVLERAAKARSQEQKDLSKVVTNPQVTTDELAGQSMEDGMAEALAEFQALATGAPTGPVKAPKEKPYTQVGCLDFQVPSHEDIFWDTSVLYMQDSERAAFRMFMPKWKYKQLRKQGYFKVDLDDIAPRKTNDIADARRRAYSQTDGTGEVSKGDVELIVYFGPLVVDDEVVKEQWFGVVANGSTLVKDVEAPYWEPPGHYTPLIFAAVREIPWRATGAGLADTGAINQQRTLDSLYNLKVDQARIGLVGITVAKEQSVIDKTIFEEGLEPGLIVGVRDKPGDVFQHVPLTSNVENTVSPVEETLRLGIEKATGVNGLVTGGRANLRSRTTAAETETQVSGANQSINYVAVNLETNFLVPVLEKSFARVLQFGLADIENNPELGQLLNEEEVAAIKELTAEDRLNIISQFYTFSVKGFSAQATRSDQLDRFNSYLEILFKSPQAAAIVHLPNLLRDYHKLLNPDSPEDYIVPGTEAEKILSENTLLLSRTMVMPSPTDNDELHLKEQGNLAGAPWATDELRQHVMMHQQQLQMKQAAQAQQQAAEAQRNAPPPKEEGPDPRVMQAIQQMGQAVQAHGQQIQSGMNAQQLLGELVKAIGQQKAPEVHVHPPAPSGPRRIVSRKEGEATVHEVA